MADNPPLFSILLPTHNRAEVLPFAIRSVLNQTCGDFELLVVGDGCTDDSANVVQGFGDPRIRWFDLPKGEGFGYGNRNTALRQARGELIAFAAHDDLMLPDHLERMAGVFAQRPGTQWAYCRPLWVDDQGIIVPFYVNLTRRHAYAQFMDRFNTIPAGCIVHRRACFEKAGMWPTDIKIAGDWALWRRIIMAYGRASLFFVRAPSHLHFRAHWRDPAEWAPRPLAYMKAIAERKPDWPAPLKLDLDESGAVPQQQVFDLMQTNPQQFMGGIREGVATLQDDLAWESTLDSQFF